MNNTRNIIFISIIALLTLIAWSIPYGMFFVYPFTIFATWVHEMAHGIAAMVLGGYFIRLELMDNGSGAAVFTYTALFIGETGKALIAAAGPLGPAIAGSIAFYASKKPKFSYIYLFILEILLVSSIILLVRPFMGFPAIVLILITGLIVFVNHKGSAVMRTFLLQTIGLQFFASIYLSISYFFSSSANTPGGSFPSDTQVIADILYLPYWFWAILILLISALLLYKSLKSIFQQKKIST